MSQRLIIKHKQPPKAKNVLLIFLLIVIAAVLLRIFVPRFYSLSVLSNILEQMSTVGILAAGISFVLVGGGMDISLSANLCCSAIAGSIVMKSTGNIALGIFLMYAVALVFGLLNGIAVAYFKMVPFIVSLSTMVVAQGLGVLLSNSKSIYGLPESYIRCLTTSIFGVPLSIYILFGFVVVYWLILNKSSLGRKIFAVGSNENAAVICGINTRAIKMLTYLFAALASGTVAMLLTARLGSATVQMASDSTNMDVMCSAILGGVSLAGGKGNVWGSFLGACFIVTFSCLVNLIGINYYPSLIIKGAIIILITCMDAYRSKQ